MRNTKILNFFLFSSLALLLIIFLLLISQNYQCQTCLDKNVSKITTVCIKDNCFDVELAISGQEHGQGLMYRQTLEENKGMLFIFAQEGIYPFWMKNTLIPLDMIWLNNNKEIVFIKKNAQPCGTQICLPIIPREKAQYVLEVNAGIAEKLGLNAGDQAILK
jgi:uncharacterized protein